MNSDLQQKARKAVGSLVQPLNPRRLTERIEGGFFRTVRLAFLVAVTGVIVGISANVFRWMFTHAADFFFGPLASTIDNESIKTALSHPYFFLIPAVGGLIVGLLMHFVLKKAEGHGVTSIMVSFELNGEKKVRPAMAAETAVTSAITIGSGGSAGPEGPAISIGSALGAGLGQLFKMSRADVKTLIACGAAAGLAALYNAPFAGTLFVLEVFALAYQAERYALILVASVIAVIAAQHILAPAPFLTEHLVQGAWQTAMPLDFLLGMFAAVVGVGFQTFLHGIGSLTDKMRKIPRWVQPALGGLVVGIIAFFAPHIMGTGEETIRGIILGSFPFALLLVFVVAKLIATGLTLGSGGSGGLFTPSVFMGAALGGAFGIAAQHFAPSAGIPTTFILIGMATVIASAVRAPLTGIFLVVGLTGDVGLMPGLIVACAGSLLLARFITPDSVYTLPMVLRGFRRLPTTVNPLAGVTTREAMDPSWPAIASGTTLREFFAKERSNGKKAFPTYAVTKDGILKGILPLASLPGDVVANENDAKYLATPVDDFMVSPRAVAPDNEKLHDVLIQPGAGEAQFIPVVNGRGSYRGMIEVAKVIPRFYSHPEKVRRGHSHARQEAKPAADVAKESVAGEAAVAK